MVREGLKGNEKGPDIS